ncbi:MAG: hypothetical protein OXR62_17145 [Ahrensia sp.]|nr:hypothetical protein [Ahrensia sp.]
MSRLFEWGKPDTVGTEEKQPMTKKPTKKTRARKTPEEQLADLTKKEDQLKARIQKKKAEVSKAARKKDTRRKIVAGAIALEHMQHDPNFAAAMKRLLQEHVTDRDRPLFDL